MARLVTGEQTLPHSKARLEFREHNGIVVEPGQTDSWACDRLSSALLVAPRRKDRPNEFLIHDSKSSTSHWRQSVAEQGYIPCPVTFANSEGQRMQVEAFVRRIPVADSWVRWGLSRWVHYIKGAGHDGRWLAKAAAGVRACFSDDGLRPQHLAAESALDSRSVFCTWRRLDRR